MVDVTTFVSRTHYEEPQKVGNLVLRYPKNKEKNLILVEKNGSLYTAAIEYFCCNLANRLHVNAPRAWLFSHDGENSYRKSAVRYVFGGDKYLPATVLIEYLAPEREQVPISESFLDELDMCRCFNALIQNQEPSYYCYQGHAYTFGFSHALGMLEEDTMEAKKLPDSPSLTIIRETIKNVTVDDLANKIFGAYNKAFVRDKILCAYNEIMYGLYV